ncbi:4-hydroxybenzoate polyprenyltransferase [Modicisalibacter xianhensis]|uniref:4-hydroxybenzoate polyprenyltransferase n=1 Tax=Modicisalibacter xianhensis TaxID=442341 RepID=A0A4R8G6Y8_9GAMM|nr:UbiA family prenyltransferase [Halomonas xianhensis]TDX32376.1 4-hydroxybenzoate polyprenyltransferase [Halomonas xianhensis]
MRTALGGREIGVKWRLWLRLGRVSNLPTVWTNGLAGWMLSTGMAPISGLWLVLVALSLFYVGGMYLNDAFDAAIDAQERADRPIPMGEVTRSTVALGGSIMLGCGVLLLFTLGAAAGLSGMALVAAIVLYNWCHKRTLWGPVVMGVCRLLTYVTAALAAGNISTWTLIGGLGLFCHVVGLTYAARQEAYDRMETAWPLAVLAVPAVILLTRITDATAIVLLVLYLLWMAWSLRLLFRRQSGDVSRAVVGMIAGIALYDAVLIGALGAAGLGWLAVAAFVLTLGLQRLVSGT